MLLWRTIRFRVDLQEVLDTWPNSDEVKFNHHFANMIQYHMLVEINRLLAEDDYEGPTEEDEEGEWTLKLANRVSMKILKDF